MPKQKEATAKPDLLPDEVFTLRPYRKDAYGDSYIERELIGKLAKNASEANEMRTIKARVDIARLIAWSGVLILLLITAACLWVFVSGVDSSKHLEESTRILFLIIGAVLGSVFRSARSHDH